MTNVTETCDKSNRTQIITDVATDANHKSDDKILTERAKTVKKKTAVDTLITDGYYCSEARATACQQQQITHIATAVKGRPPPKKQVPISKFQIQGEQIVACPQGKQPIFQRYDAEKQRFHVRMVKQDCDLCALKAQCIVKERQNYFSAHFTRRSYEVSKNREKLDDEHHQQMAGLRPAVAWASTREHHG